MQKSNAKWQEAIDREAKAIEQAEQAKRDKIASENLAEENRIKAAAQAKVDAAIAAENAKQAEIDRQNREQAEADRRQRLKEENIQHVSNIRRQAKEALMNTAGINEETAKIIVMAIHKKEIANVSINY